MINFSEVAETNAMIDREGISLLDCADSDLGRLRTKIYDKITTSACNLVRTGEEITREYGIPIVNKRISITPIAIAAASACRCSDDFVSVAKTLDRAAKEVGVNFLGGYSALVSKGMTPADRMLIESIPDALAQTDVVCSSVNVGSTKTGIDMDAVRLMGSVIKRTAERTADRDSFGCAKLVVFCNAPDDNPFMAGAFHGVTEADRILNIGVSGPGVVKRAWPPAGWAYPSVSSTCPWRPHRLSVTAWQISSARWALNAQARPAPPQPWPSSTTRSKRAASWPPPMSAAFPAPSSLSVRTEA